jgi:hypothetical protein
MAAAAMATARGGAGVEAVAMQRATGAGAGSAAALASASSRPAIASIARVAVPPPAGRPARPAGGDAPAGRSLMRAG